MGEWLCVIITIGADRVSLQTRHCGQRGVELIEIKWLEKKAIRPSEFRLVGQWGSGHQDHWKARPLMFDLLEDEEPILARHTDIAKHYVARLLLQCIEGVGSRLRRPHPHAGEGSLQHDLDKHQNTRLIVDEQYA